MDRTRNRKLLVSVFSQQEAREAILGGARIIDSEDLRSALVDSVLTYNELMLNPVVNESVRAKLGVDPKANINVSSKMASMTAEF